jgi:hypothetical protein
MHRDERVRGCNDQLAAEKTHHTKEIFVQLGVDGSRESEQPERQLGTG